MLCHINNRRCPKCGWAIRKGEDIYLVGTNPSQYEHVDCPTEAYRRRKEAQSCESLSPAATI